MAVVSKANAPAVFELKSAALTLIAVVLKTTDLAALERELDARVADTPGLFEHEPVVIDLGAVQDEADPIDFGALVKLLRRYDMLPIAVKRGSAVQTAAALAAGLSEAPEGAVAATAAARALAPAPQGGHAAPASPSSASAAAPAGPRRPPRTEVVLTEVIQEAPQPAPSTGTGTLVIDKPLRSGQQVYARGADLVVMAAVNFGAEVIADGHIHVYGPLRGRAIAGARGNTAARIFSTCMEPQLVAIAGTYRTTETELPESVLGRPAQVRLDGEKLVVEAIDK